MVGTFVVLQQAPPHSFSGAPVTHARHFWNKRAAVYGLPLLAVGLSLPALDHAVCFAPNVHACLCLARFFVGRVLITANLRICALVGIGHLASVIQHSILGEINNLPHRFRTQRLVVSIDGILSYCAPSATICSWSRWPKGPCPNRGHALWIP